MPLGMKVVVLVVHVFSSRVHHVHYENVVIPLITLRGMPEAPQVV